jgi:predicted GNAT superfamily acetyltransferase
VDAASAIVVRAAGRADHEAIVAINDAEVAHTSAMDAARLALLDGLSIRHTVAVGDAEVAGFLLAIGADAAYANDNHRWFVERFGNFVYIDRVVVGARWRGRGVGRALYADLFAWARGAGLDRVACEINRVPANPASHAFHARCGFAEVGRQWLGGKQVSMQVAPLA